MADIVPARDTTRGLIARIAQGDAAAHASLCTTHEALFNAIARGILGTESDADRARQAIGAALWRDAVLHPASGLSARAWLVTLARDEALALCRTRAPGQDAPPDVAILADLAPDLPPLGSRLATPDADRAEALARAIFLGEDLAALAARFGMSAPRLRRWLRDGLALDDDDALCAEQAIGLLPPEEASAFAARLGSDPAFRARAILWSEDLASLFIAQTRPAAAVISAPDGQGWLARLGFLPAIVGALVAGLLVLGADRAGLLLPDPAAVVSP